jgi:hypothetical protein
MILSASRRTDIPCYYSDWLMNRLKAGYVLTRNPMNHAQLSKILLTPDVVDCIVFWTKDAKNILPHLKTLDHIGYSYYFQFTLTPYDRVIEPGLRDKTDLEDTFIELSKRIGKEHVVWRYDPIILNETIDISYHQTQFLRLCDRLSPYCDTVTISFVDLYSKLKTPHIREITAEETAELSAFIGKTAWEHGLNAASCCEKGDLFPFGIRHAACIDKERIEKLLGCTLDLPADKNQRPGCGCAESIDIGAYNTCPNGCVYCYANTSPAAALRRLSAHDPGSPILVGEAAAAEKVTDRKVKTHKLGQTALY